MAEPLQFPDHTHRWQERSQETLDAEYSETGALLGRWYCPGCYEETDTEPDPIRESALLTALTEMLIEQSAAADEAAEDGDEPSPAFHRGVRHMADATLTWLAAIHQQDTDRAAR